MKKWIEIKQYLKVIKIEYADDETSVLNIIVRFI